MGEVVIADVSRVINRETNAHQNGNEGDAVEVDAPGAQIGNGPDADREDGRDHWENGTKVHHEQQHQDPHQQHGRSSNIKIAALLEYIVILYCWFKRQIGQCLHLGRA